MIRIKILVTGAAGSIGSELARLISTQQPEKLILVDRSENTLFELQSELTRKFPTTSLIVRIADVTDQVSMHSIISETKPQTIFHAAAHKHVTFMENSPGEAISNNLGGTYTTAQIAVEHGVETFVLVSTDKAVNPTSVMGATKRLCELLVNQMNKTDNTKFVTVRFGNVLGSNGSVVPIFKNQIEHGGPITITSPHATRYFMSIPEAAGLILQAGSIAEGGEIFVLEMGEPIKILNLAETMISLSGLGLNEHIDIVYTGLKPGEKLHEELNYNNEDFAPTGYDKLLVLKPIEHDSNIEFKVKSILEFDSKNYNDLKLQLSQFLPEYHPN